MPYIVLKIYSNALGIIPFKFLSFESPSIVNVFPVPVYPYANIVPLYPYNTDSTIPKAQSSYILSYFDYIPYV